MRLQDYEEELAMRRALLRDATGETEHAITLHCIALHYITLYYIALHCITLRYVTLHYILHYIALHFALYFALHFALHCVALHYCGRRDGARRHPISVTLHCIPMHPLPLRSVAVHITA